VYFELRVPRCEYATATPVLLSQIWGPPFYQGTLDEGAFPPALFATIIIELDFLTKISVFI